MLICPVGWKPLLELSIRDTGFGMTDHWRAVQLECYERSILLNQDDVRRLRSHFNNLV